jgi:hypothetical protein
VLFGPSGEIGRHSGLKIRRFVNSGRTGSIPVSGTTSGNFGGYGTSGVIAILGC